MADAIAGTYSDLRLVRGRKVAQIVIEVPIEQAKGVVDLLGMPLPDQEIWVGIARLERDIPKRPVREQTEGERAVTRAVMLCKDVEFMNWATAALGGPPNEGVARLHILTSCDISSRGELANNPEALEKFKTLETSFRYREQLR